MARENFLPGTLLPVSASLMSGIKGETLCFSF